VTSRSREIDEEEQVDPPVVRKVAPPVEQVQREQVAPLVMRQVAPPVVRKVAPPVAHVQRE